MLQIFISATSSEISACDEARMRRDVSSSEICGVEGHVDMARRVHIHKHTYRGMDVLCGPKAKDQSPKSGPRTPLMRLGVGSLGCGFRHAKLSDSWCMNWNSLEVYSHRFTSINPYSMP